MIENLLILDTETTGLDPKRGAQVIEIAVLLFNIKQKAVLQCFSTLLPCTENPVQNVNHISAEMTQCDYAFKGKGNLEVFEECWKNPDDIITLQSIGMGEIFIDMNAKAQAIVAHNADFDRRFIATQPWSKPLVDKKWICTKSNFSWPPKLLRFRLEDICNVMGVPYVNAHRAMADCFLLAQCFQKVDDLQQRIDRC